MNWTFEEAKIHLINEAEYLRKHPKTLKGVILREPLFILEKRLKELEE